MGGDNYRKKHRRQDVKYLEVEAEKPLVGDWLWDGQWERPPEAGTSTGLRSEYQWDCVSSTGETHFLKDLWSCAPRDTESLKAWLVGQTWCLKEY